MINKIDAEPELMLPTCRMKGFRNKDMSSSGPNANGVVKYFGVRLINGRYQANIRAQKKGPLLSLGMFETAQEAARAWDSAAYNIHGQ